VYHCRKDLDLLTMFKLTASVDSLREAEQKKLERSRR